MNTPYQNFLNDSMLEFVKKILSRISTDAGKLQSNQLLYISYRTDNPEVILSPKIKERYPKEITIVMQYQFDELLVKNEGFSVIVSFDGIKEIIYVPFSSLISFIDPNNNYSLKFKQKIVASNQIPTEGNTQWAKSLTDLTNKSDSKNNIIILDKFRKPNKLK
jgi:hypothetical protein